MSGGSCGGGVPDGHGELAVPGQASLEGEAEVVGGGRGRAR